LDKEKMKSLLIMQVHDELVLEVPEAELAVVKEKIPQLMENVTKLDVSLVADLGVGNNWDEAH
ncbi:MAG TPA: DNA polymerase, partial [Burkholderiales bacterium]|nr:DNA polymerase [Burkholderiales bacterium]